jgi:thiamine-monophosphate kinase
MDERAALAVLADRLDPVGDDCAVVDGHVLTTDMLHERTDFPAGTTRYTMGWRAVGASLSDVAAMGADADAAVAVYAAPAFENDELTDFVDGADDVCSAVDAAYVGGDLDTHEELTVATTALGSTTAPVRRDGSNAGETVCVTGTLGRSAAALSLFDDGDDERANRLFRFQPRVAAGRRLADHATAMLDSSDGLARSCHQLAAASGCGIALEEDAIPYDDTLRETVDDEDRLRERGLFFGEDFELVCSVPPAAIADLQATLDVDLTVIGETTAHPSVTIDGEPLPDEGYTHG